MARMLRHKETGELFVYTDAYAKLPELELVPENPVEKVIAEVSAKDSLAASLAAELAAPAKKKAAISKSK